MGNDIKANMETDLSVLGFPLLGIKSSKEIKEVEVGQVIEAVTTDPGSLIDFPALAETSGSDILKTV